MKTRRLSECKKVWEEIFSLTPNRSPFLSYDWFSSLAMHLKKADPDVLVFYSDDKPVAVLPAGFENDKWTFVADERVTDLCDLLYVPDYGQQVVEEFGLQAEAQEWHIDLFPLSDGGLLFRSLPAIMERAKTVDADMSPLLSLPGSWDEYLGKLNGKQRHELRRKLRGAGEVVLKAAPPEQIELLFDLMVASNDEKKAFLDDQMRDFFIAIARAFSMRGWFRYRIAFSGQDVIAAVLSFHHNGYVYLYNTGFNPESRVGSPGFVAIALDIRSSIEAGDRYYDFLRGAERFKFNLGAGKRFMKRIQC